MLWDLSPRVRRAARYSSSMVAQLLTRTPKSAARACNPAATCMSALSARLFQVAAVAHQRVLEAVGTVDALVTEAVAIGNPGFVDGLVLARHNPHQAPAQYVTENVAADAIVRRDERRRGHLPGTRAEAVGLGNERADRAQVDDVARQLVVDRALYVSAHLHVLTAADHAEFLDAGDFLREANAARAVDATGHVGGDERPQVLVLDRALALVIARHIAAEPHGQVLQLALPALVADRAVERVIDEQELHGRALRADRPRRLG